MSSIPDAHHPILSRNLEQMLARIAAREDAPGANDEHRARGERAVQAIIRCNQRLAIRYATAKVAGHFRYPTDDAINNALVGIAEAARRYEPGLGRFSTLAYHYMKKEILENWQAECYPVPLSRSVAARRGTILRRGPKTRGEEELLYRTAAVSRVVSVHGLRATRGEPADDLAGVGIAELIDGDARDHAARIVDAALATLDPRAGAILADRFGIGGRPPKSLSQIGRDHGISKERVRQIQDAALGSLRELAANAGAAP